jgi:hypothetical protein
MRHDPKCVFLIYWCLYIIMVDLLVALSSVDNQLQNHGEAAFKEAVLSSSE